MLLPTPTQIAAWTARESARRTRLSDHKARVERMLTRHMSLQQRLSWLRGWIWVTGSQGGTYWLSRTATMRVIDDRLLSYCIHAPDGPDLDSMVAIKLLLETDEQRFHWLAHYEGELSEPFYDLIQAEAFYHLDYLMEADKATTVEEVADLINDYKAGLPPPSLRSGS
jgi:hypothetical protein